MVDMYKEITSRTAAIFNLFRNAEHFKNKKKDLKTALKFNEIVLENTPEDYAPYLKEQIPFFNELLYRIEHGNVGSDLYNEIKNIKKGM